MRGSRVDIWKLLKIITPYLNYGMSLEKACKVTGLNVQTFYNYMRKDDEIKSEIDKQKELGLALCRQSIFRAAHKGEWRAALAILERKERKEWSPPDRVEISGPEGGEIEHKVNAKDIPLDKAIEVLKTLLGKK